MGFSFSGDEGDFSLSRRRPLMRSVNEGVCEWWLVVCEWAAGSEQPRVCISM